MQIKYQSPAKFGEVFPDSYRQLPSHWFDPFWVNIDLGMSTKEYGSNDFHGRFHPSIVDITVRRFTKPGDTIWDVFAGSGTTIDVCKELGRKCMGTDLHPTRDDIIQADSAKYVLQGPVQAVIMHPPYMDIIDYNSPMSTTRDVEVFRDLLEDVVCNADRYLEPGRVICTIIGEIFNSELIPLEYIFYNILKSYSYRLLGRVVKDYGLDTEGGKSSGAKNNNLWNYRVLKYGYFRYGIDTVMWWQKPG